MDFESMMNAANKNAKKASREIEKVQDEVHKEKNEVKRQLEAEKRLRLEMQKRKAEKARELDRRKEDERRKQFTIPRKNDKESGSGVNPDALKAYYEKQEKIKKQKEKQAEVEKEQLMKLRMQANGGKATKKLGKHFGLDVVDLQIRFGGNNEHVETLQKRKWKEEEDADMEADKYRTGVYKALQMKKKNEEKLRSNVKGPHRISTSKSNSLAGLCSRHGNTRDTFSPPKDGKKEKTEKKEPEKKKIQHAAPVDFRSLMAAASSISQGKSVKLDQFETKPLKPSSSSNGGGSSSNQKPSSSSSSNYTSKNAPKNTDRNGNNRDNVKEKERIRENKERDLKRAMDKERSRIPDKPSSSSYSSSSSNNRPSSSSKPPSRPQVITSVKSVDISMDAKSKDKKDEKGRFKKAATPPPVIPTIIPGKKYLPGDMRYKEAMAMAKADAAANAALSNTAVNTAKQRIANVREQERLRELEREKVRRLKRDRQERETREMERPPKVRKMDKSVMRGYDSRREAELRQEQMRMKSGKSSRDDRNRGSSSNGRSGGSSSFCRGGDDYSDDDDEEAEDYEDEYDDDSEMDDFIDDTELDMDGMSRQEFEDTLRMVNRKYDKKKWSQREKMISERDMSSDYRRIQSEEKYSKQAGIMEDLIEAKKGRSYQL